MNYRSPIAGLEHQLEALTEELRTLREKPKEDAATVSPSAELVRLRADVEQSERRAEELRRTVEVRALTPKERAQYMQMRSVSILMLVLGALVGACELFAFVRGWVESLSSTYFLVGVLASVLLVLVGGISTLGSRADARNRRANRIEKDDFES